MGHLSNTDRDCVSTSYGLLFWPSLRKIIRAAGYRIRPKILARGNNIAVWGRVQRSRDMISKYPDANILTFEDAFLRSVVPGSKTPPIGITIDDLGVHFDSQTPSRLEVILQSANMDSDLLERAKNGREFLRHYGLSKYNAVPRGYGKIPEAGFVLVTDQVVGDASVAGGQADAQTFVDMLATAKQENPGKKIIIRAHPAAIAGKVGYFQDVETDENLSIQTDIVNPWDLLERADKVYCVSSQLGFEAILAGHKPVVFGAPFYAGWGLSEDRQSLLRRTKKLTVEQLFVGAMIQFPFWFDRTRNQQCQFETAAYQLLSEARHRWDGLPRSTLLGMRLWKRASVKRFLEGADNPPTFAKDASSAIQIASDNGQVVVWATHGSEGLVAPCREKNIPLVQMEDGFLRSNGLGAELTPASSLVLDNIGIYYDPTEPSSLENLIGQSAHLPDFAIARASQLRREVVAAGVTKYNIDNQGDKPIFPPDKKIILVPGQVEDDASIKYGAGKIRTNLALLKAVRLANPDAYLIYKPHPDVVAGLRNSAAISHDLYDYLADKNDAAVVLEWCDEVWTMTSLLGFEALLRKKRVVCYGLPFYAGWGLTQDVGMHCERRKARINLDQLTHAALIDYPRYMDPISGLPCTPECIVNRLKNRETRHRPTLRVLAKLQGWLSGYAYIWR